MGGRGRNLFGKGSEGKEERSLRKKEGGERKRKRVTFSS